MVVRSLYNNRLAPLAALAAFTGEPEETKAGNAISVAIYVSELTTLDIQQAPNKSNFYIFQHYTIQPNQQYIIQVPCALEYFRVNIHNEAETNQAYCYMVTSLVQELTQGASVGLTPVANTVTYNDPVTAGSYTSDPYDLGENSLLDVLLYAEGTISNGNVRIDYSADGTIWFPNNTSTIALSVSDPHQTLVGLKVATRYVRISTTPASPFRATNLKITFSSKRD